MNAPPPSSPVHVPVATYAFHALTRWGKFIKTLTGLAMFLIWLLLFVFGMSLRADDYRECILQGERINYGYLWLYAASFTPINAAMLASLAGILGGFASNLTADNQFRHLGQTQPGPDSPEFDSYLYMTENPLVSMLRGFITYLIFIAGSYLTNFTSAVDPQDTHSFIGLTASSYFKFAVSVSLLAYLAGYDPSRMKSLINSVGFTRKDAAPPAQVAAITHQKTETETLKVTTSGTQPSINGQPVVAG